MPASFINRPPRDTGVDARLGSDMFLSDFRSNSDPFALGYLLRSNAKLNADLRTGRARDKNANPRHEGYRAGGVDCEAVASLKRACACCDPESLYGYGCSSASLRRARRR